MSYCTAEQDPNRESPDITASDFNLSHQELIEQYEQAIAVGDARAMCNRALMHEEGRGGPENYQQAIALYERAIALGDADAMYNRALMHEEGRGGPENYQQAIALYERVIALGGADAMYKRALMHEEGRGGPENYQQAIALYERAIALGDTDAMFKRALMHEEGRGGPENHQQAIALYERAIALGDADAMYNRALMHEEGRGGPKNYQQAIELYERAIVLGDTDAMFKRALMHEKGRGGPENYQQAIALYERAIALGNADAMYNRALMHEKGLGGPEDYTMAMKLHVKGAALGDIDCKSELSKTVYIQPILSCFKKNKAILSLFNAIDEIDLYLRKIFESSELSRQKNKELSNLHIELNEKLTTFLVGSVCNPPTIDSLNQFKTDFILLANSKNDLMERHREQWKPIIANILIALTGIGLLAIVINAVLTKPVFKKSLSFNNILFFAKTNSEQLIANVVKNAEMNLTDFAWIKS